MMRSTVISFLILNIGAEAAKLNTPALRCSQKFPAGFEPKMYLNIVGPNPARTSWSQVLYMISNRPALTKIKTGRVCRVTL